MKKYFLGLLALLPWCFFAQKQIIQQQQMWYGYYNKLRISDNWEVNSQIEERQFYNPTAQYQFVVRTNLDRKILENINVSAGFVLFFHNPNDPNSQSKLTIPELRPDIGFNSKRKFRYFTMSNRYKLEARFMHQNNGSELGNGFVFSNFRFRYQIGFEVPLLKQIPQISFVAKDEIMFNFGKKITKNVFDQNRLYFALNYKLSKQLALEAGYLNYFQQTSKGDVFYERDIVRFSIIQNIDLTKK